MFSTSERPASFWKEPVVPVPEMLRVSVPVPPLMTSFPLLLIPLRFNAPCDVITTSLPAPRVIVSILLSVVSVSVTESLPPPVVTVSAPAPVVINACTSAAPKVSIPRLTARSPA